MSHKSTSYPDPEFLSAARERLPPVTACRREALTDGGGVGRRGCGAGLTRTARPGSAPSSASCEKKEKEKDPQFIHERSVARTAIPAFLRVRVAYQVSPQVGRAREMENDRHKGNEKARQK